MELKQIDTSEALDWAKLFPRHDRMAAPAKTLWELAILLIVIVLHMAVLAYLFSWRANLQINVAVPDDALQVTFIERISLPDTKQAATDRNVKNKFGSTARTSPTTNASNETVLEMDGKQLPDKTLRLTLDSDEWQIKLDAFARSPLKRQYIALPGRAESFVHGIRLSKNLSPQQKLQMIGKLFGAVDYDPCKEARNRMASGQSQLNDLDVEADLRSIELHCRP